MNRCVICQCYAKNLLCDGCQSLITPVVEACQRCAKPLPNPTNSDSLLCSDCRKTLPSFDGIVCAGIYQPPGSEWVMGLKFSGHLHWARAMAELLSPIILQLPADWPLLAMPLHRHRLRTRGYNQAHEVTRLLAQQTGRKELTDVIVRSKYTAMQATLPERQRRANVKNAFSVKCNELPPSIILVDDVLTTGQTLSAAAAVLKKAGVETVYGAVFLRSGA